MKRKVEDETGLLAGLLARCDLSVAQAHARLIRAGESSDRARESIDRALALGWLDDRRLAGRIVQKELERKPPPSRAALEDKLAGREIPDPIRQEALLVVDPDDLDRRLVDWVRAQAGRVPPGRLASRLVRAGHDPDRVAEILSSVDPGDDDRF